jgi:hypothetical protein
MDEAIWFIKNSSSFSLPTNEVTVSIYGHVQ